MLMDALTPALQCQGTKADGSPCGQVTSVSPTTGLCIWHDLERAVEATAARRRGAERTNSREPQPDDVPPPPEPKTLDDVCAWLSWVTVALARGQVDKSVATGCTYALQNLKAALSMRELEAKYKALAQRIEALQRSQGQ